ncbi:MAG TPA: hypothetical protein VLB84_09945 [Bacteroidia bacterium]|nr:hypothetical protein [Bacteroidia bacterium]
MMELLRRELPKYGGTFIQCEDEIANRLFYCRFVLLKPGSTLYPVFSSYLPVYVSPIS